jgi:hypothetical protein
MIQEYAPTHRHNPPRITESFSACRPETPLIRRRISINHHVAILINMCPGRCYKSAIDVDVPASVLLVIVSSTSIGFMANIVVAPAQNPSILSVVQKFASSEALAQHSPHLFSADPDVVLAQLKELIETTVHISGSLNAHPSIPFSNAKLYSLLRQQTAMTNTVHNVSIY